MADSGALIVRKKVSELNKHIKIDFKKVFSSLGKGVVHGVTGNWANLAKDCLGILTAVRIKKDIEETTWLLIISSIIQAMADITENQKELFEDKNVNLPDDMDKFSFEFDYSFENKEISLELAFFDYPKELEILNDIQTVFCKWLKGLGIDPAKAKSMSYRLPGYFVFAIHDQWRNAPDKYNPLKEKLHTPFKKSVEQEQAWRHYQAFLQRQIDVPIFNEAFGLAQVYVYPNAYYIQTEKKDLKQRYSKYDELIKKKHKRVVSLEQEINNWLNAKDKEDAIRVICGGPGYGKSSFSKMLAARLSEQNNCNVLFIPLHLISPEKDLTDAVGDFVDHYQKYFKTNPLNDLKNKNQSPLLIIFDGLDELSSKGKVGLELAQKFISEVKLKVNTFNFENLRLRVLISGRDVVVQANTLEFRKNKQVLHLLPYYIPKDDRTNYLDPDNLLADDNDLRKKWWQKYARVTGKNYESIPEELDRDNLLDLNSQPLLCYLLALSYDRGKIEFSENTNLNSIYQDLIEQVYERGWAGKQHPTIKELEEEDFIMILEEIAVTLWHSESRAASIDSIEKRCKQTGIWEKFKVFHDAREAHSITRLLTAFYFRQASQDSTFEFTHKTFGEYLSARSIVGTVFFLHDELRNQHKKSRSSFDRKAALQLWVELCGPSHIDNYLLDFILSEMELLFQHDSDMVKDLQKTLADLIGYMLIHGMPMESFNQLSFLEMNLQARNAEEALLAVLYACARLTKKTSVIKWLNDYTFLEWLFRIRSFKSKIPDSLFLYSLEYINLENAILKGANLINANLEGANLKGANLKGANLIDANLKDTNLIEANLIEANLIKANLIEANLENGVLLGANLINADLINANLKGANLEDAILEDAILEDANLEGANLINANLENANLKGANLINANLKGVILKGANLERANLINANLENAILEGFNPSSKSSSINEILSELELDIFKYHISDKYSSKHINDYNISKYNLKGANLKGANLIEANLKGVDLEGANLENTNFEKSIYDEHTNLKGTIYEGLNQDS